MVISYNLDIPDAPNNPSVDQPNMRTNTNSINTIIAVDHYPFAAEPAGTHKQVTISDKNAAGVQTDPASVIYTESGPALTSTVAQLKYRNQNGIFPLSCVRAWASFPGTTAVGAVPVIQSVNINAATGVQKLATGSYTVTPDANSVITSNLAVFLTTSSSGSSGSISATYSVSAGPVINIVTRAPASGSNVDCGLISVMIVQL